MYFTYMMVFVLFLTFFSRLLRFTILWWFFTFGCLKNLLFTFYFCLKVFCNVLAWNDNHCNSEWAHYFFIFVWGPLVRIQRRLSLVGDSSWTAERFSIANRGKMRLKTILPWNSSCQCPYYSLIITKNGYLVNWK
jgi:hypothetical protein